MNEMERVMDEEDEEQQHRRNEVAPLDELLAALDASP